jgi:hypothetical protein
MTIHSPIRTGQRVALASRPGILAFIGPARELPSLGPCRLAYVRFDGHHDPQNAEIYLHQEGNWIDADGEPVRLEAL